ncbi:MAG: DUF116 domain-containing protein [Clostridiaceae bacterium]|nr:DUF116 domain-containing protein [Clostridiaceae bacterium]
MDKRLKSLMGYTLLLLLVIGLMVLLFSYIYHLFSIDLYNSIINILIIISIMMMVSLVIAMAAIFIALKTRRVYPFMIFPVKLGMKIVLPFALFVTDVLKNDKDMIRSLFIDINNLFVESGNIRRSPDKVLLLLPHCLQDSECSRKITNNVSNCVRCGRCKIGEIIEMAEKRGVQVFVATGGTAARNAIAKLKPEIVLSVACERDLAIGISDVSKIPVIGVLNNRPNGPCVNTTVDVDVLAGKLDKMLAEPAALQENGS